MSRGGRSGVRRGMLMAGLLGIAALAAAGPAQALQAGQTARVVGLLRDAASRSDLEIVDLGTRPATCEVALVRADGTRAGDARTLVVKPGVPAVLPDALAEQAPIRDASATVRCDEAFSTSAVVTAPGEVRHVGAALELPVALDGTTTCPTGHLCYDYDGVVHTSTPANPAKFITLTPPPATYGTVKVHLEVQVNGFARPSAAAHGLLYMVRDNNKDMFASAFLRGPSSNLFTLRHGFGLLSAQKAKLTTPFTAVTGTVYALDYLYDPAHKSLVMTLSDAKGHQLARVSDLPNVTKVPFVAGDFILISLSNSGVHNGKPNPQEPASLNWVYQNFHVEMVPLGSP